MTTLPKRTDGGIDWEKMSFPRGINVYLLRQDGLLSDHIGSSENVAKQLYIAALKRCAEWHDEQEKIAKNDLGVIGGVEELTHKQSAAEIRRWIEEEKGNG